MSRRLWRWLAVGAPLLGALIAALDANWWAMAWALFAAWAAHSAEEWRDLYYMASKRADRAERAK